MLLQHLKDLLGLLRALSRLIAIEPRGVEEFQQFPIWERYVVLHNTQSRCLSGRRSRYSRVDCMLNGLDPRCYGSHLEKTKREHTVVLPASILPKTTIVCSTISLVSGSSKITVAWSGEILDSPDSACKARYSRHQLRHVRLASLSISAE
ncbi:hypothetical protein DFP72DRAFT_885731 [Ephemerocybe angulata]|uniref:Uncharacterized protein n=1 Tax=Ephemerocybe angulata TaxID=980116 RepID=A0A8H6I5F7_9AGAR|nr:hypothetical protein DFP72DRAFT_885731 [Tulosesus angulatus]